VVFNFIVIGEAVGRLPKEFLDDHPDVPWSFMRGMRNILVHQYFGIDPETVWETAPNDLPPLIGCLETLRDQLGDEPLAD